MLFKQRDFRESDGWLGRNKEDAGGGVEPITSGSLTLQAATTGYDIDFVDIPFAKGELTALDVIKIIFFGDNAADKAVTIQIKINNTTVTGAIINNKDIFGAANNGYAWDFLGQSANTNDIMVAYHRHYDGSVVNNTTGILDTNDANIFTTAWTLRLNFKFPSIASADTKILYQVIKILGQ